MEPRPLKPPPRQAPTPSPVPSSPPRDRGSWVPPVSTRPANGGATYPAPSPPPATATAYPAPAADPLAARAAWYDPAIPAAANGAAPQPGERGYSPGPALTPIDGGRGARILGPLLALLVLAAVIVAAFFVGFKIFGGDDDGDKQVAQGGTATAIAGAAPAATGTVAVTTTAAAGAPTATGANAVAGAEETAAPTVTPPAKVQQSGTESPPKPTATPAAQAASARAMLPSSSELPAGFERTEDDKRTEDEVAQSLPDAAEATKLLGQWDWRENAYRTFEIPASSNPDPNSTTYVNISIHRFGNAKGASKALTYFSDSVQTAQGLQEITVDTIGDRTVALSGAPDGSNLVVLYIRSGSYLIRIGGSSPAGDPTETVIAVAKAVVGTSR